MALDSIRSHKLRSFLTVLGIVIGVMTVIGMVSVIQGLNRSFRSELESAGSDLIFIQKYEPVQMGERSEEERQRKDFDLRRRPGDRAGLPPGQERGRHAQRQPVRSHRRQVPEHQERQLHHHRGQREVPDGLLPLPSPRRTEPDRLRDPPQRPGLRPRLRDRGDPLPPRAGRRQGDPGRGPEAHGRRRHEQDGGRCSARAGTTSSSCPSRP